MTKQIMLLLSLMTVAGVSYAQVNDTVRVRKGFAGYHRHRFRHQFLPLAFG